MPPVAPKKNDPVFDVMASWASGLKTAWAQRRMFALLSVMPIVATFATLLVARFIKFEGLFWAPILQLPASFMVGMLFALILRLLLLSEFPVVSDVDKRKWRNGFVFQAAFVYVSVEYLMAGVLSALVLFMPIMQANPEAAAPYMPFLLAVIILMLWAARWFWLHVPVALGWSVEGFYKRLGGWSGSARVFGLYVLCSFTVNAVVSLLWRLLRELNGVTDTQRLSGAYALVGDMILAVGTVAASVLLAVATAHAVQQMLKHNKVKVDV